VCLLVAAGASLAACKASVSAEVNAQSNDMDDVQDFDDPMAESSQSKDTFMGQQSADRAMLGARHDLALAGDSAQASCTCLAAVVGYPSNPAFFWQAVVPTIDTATQLVIAFSSDGVSCTDQPGDSLGASYWGYRREGDDIIVVLENARAGRPLTSGAIIPRPVGAGSVYVAPLNKSVPYGRSLDGSGGRCRLEIATSSGQPVVPPPSNDETAAPAP
jgi:hypothetical protein